MADEESHIGGRIPWEGGEAERGLGSWGEWERGPRIGR